jgi:DNA (cytosine-5)-methyltransferase 1
MNFGSLFTGIGGLDLGLERAGMRCAWQVEIDDYATRVLERHWPGVKRWRDIADFIADTNKPEQGQQPQRRKVGRVWRVRQQSKEISAVDVDLICGGFPCQPVSLAGSRRGDADERWLWPQFRRVVGLIRPRYVVVENVPGLLSADDGRLFGGILRDLAAMGFDAEWGVLPASAFGAPHLRRRVFIVAYANGSTGRWREIIGEGWNGESALCGKDRIASDTQSNGWGEGRAKPTREQGRFNAAECRKPARNADESRLAQRKSEPRDTRPQQSAIIGTDWRLTEPTIRRGDYGTANRVDRLRCLGNAVVPQVAEWIGKRIIEHDAR